jgi:hypothetical protein
VEDYPRTGSLYNMSKTGKTYHPRKFLKRAPALPHTIKAPVVWSESDGESDRPPETE